MGETDPERAADPSDSLTESCHSKQGFGPVMTPVPTNDRRVAGRPQLAGQETKITHGSVAGVRMVVRCLPRVMLTRKFCLA